jgi:hypothetical protein
MADKPPGATDDDDDDLDPWKYVRSVIRLDKRDGGKFRKRSIERAKAAKPEPDPDDNGKP